VLLIPPLFNPNFEGVLVGPTARRPYSSRQIE